MKVRPAREEDWEAIRQLIEQSSELIKTHLPGWRSFFVAEEDGAVVVGCCALAVLVMEDMSPEDTAAGRSPKSAEIRCLTVDPNYRNGMTGSRLLRACKQRAEELGIYEVFTFTNVPSLFQRLGFSTASEKTGKDVMFVVLGNGE